MLKFFYRSWADLEPMSGDWFYDEQEERVFRLLVGSLRHRESYLACELPRAAFDYGQRFAHDLEAFRRDYVLVDDYQMASRASQCSTRTSAPRKTSLRPMISSCKRLSSISGMIVQLLPMIEYGSPEILVFPLNIFTQEIDFLLRYVTM